MSVQGDPRLVWCSNCFAKAGESCTQPTDTGRTPVRWYHLAREARAQGDPLAGVPWWLLREAEASVRLSRDDEDGTHVVGGGEQA